MGMKKNPLELPSELRYSAWDDAKFTLWGIGMILFPVAVLVAAGYLLLG
jgi:hypothetical protein